MTEVVVFDAWAWWETLLGTPAGAKLMQKYLEGPEFRVLTVDVALAEISSKMARNGVPEETAPALNAVEAGSEVIPISRAAAEAAGPLVVELRKTDRGASLMDAIMLASAREQGAKLVSGDRAFARQRDVVRS
jgi:predicted nucleic acid-binding protein